MMAGRSEGHDATCVGLCSYSQIILRALNHQRLTIPNLMKKGMKHAKERAGRVLNKLRPASGSQSSATPEVELSSVTPSLPPYILAAVNELKTLATRADQLQTPPLEIQIADALSAGPDSIPPTSSTGETDSDDQKALKVSSRSDGSVSNELSETALLPMDVSLGSPPSLGDPLDAVSRSSQAILNNNQNTTYNFGRDVINYNPVINLNYNTRGEVCYSGYSLQHLYSTFPFPRRRIP